MNYLERFDQYVDSIKKHTETLFPIESRKKRLEITNVRVADTSHERAHNWADFQKAKEHDRSFMGRIVGDVTLRDKASGEVLEHKKDYTLNMFPHVTALGSYIVGGKDLQVVNQLRRRPGAYPVIATDNNAVTKVTAAGMNHDAILDRETGQLLLKVKTSHLKLVPLLQEMGIHRDDLEKHLGKELVAANQPKEGARSELLKFYQLNRRMAPPANEAERRESIVNYLASKRVDPDVTQDTLGHRHEHVSPQLYLHAAQAAVDVAKGTRQPADMESLVYKSVHAIEDFVDESLKEAYPHLKRRLAYMMDRKKDIKSFLNVDQLAKPIINKFVTSEFTRYSDQSNPLDILGTMHTVTSLGEGGIQSTHAITDALRNVHNSHFGFLDAVHTPENSAIGVVGHLALGVHKRGNQLVRTVYDTHEKRLVEATPVEISRGGIAFPDQFKTTKSGVMEPLTAKITAITHEGKIDQVHHTKVRYVLPSPTGAFSLITNAIPFLHVNSANRMLMADRHMEQSVPLVYRDVPLVQAEFEGQGYAQMLGKAVTAVADRPGRVKSVRDDHVQVVYDNEPNKVVKYFYTAAYPFNSGTVLKMDPIVKQGQRLKAGTHLFDTNFTKDGSFALGKQLRTAFMPWRGANYEDGIVISESAAKKMTSEHLTEHRVEKEPGVSIGFDKLYAAFPAEREKSPNHRLPKIGDIVKPGQLLIPAVRVAQINPDTDYSKVHKALRQPFHNVSVYWDGVVDGKVTKVISGAGLVKVYVESHEPMVIGDKLSNYGGGKGIVTQILSNDQMPRTKDGELIDVIYSPFGIPGRVNTTLLLENSAGKIARKTGKPYMLEMFDTSESVTKRVLADLKKHGLTDTETVVDPVHQKEHQGIMVGENHWLKLRHQVKKKWAARSHEGPYTIDERPARGGHESAQGLGPLDLYALLSNGFTKFLGDAANIKSTKNSDHWAAYQLGLPTPTPKRPFILDKFETYLQGAGINIQRQGDTLRASPLTDKDIRQRSHGVITDPQIFRVSKTGLQPERGGLYDPEITGGSGSTRWNHLELAEPILNPLYERPVKAITGLATKDLDAILAGKQFVGKKTGGAALHELLSNIDVKQELTATQQALRKAPASKRDELLRKVRYLSGLDKLGIRPEDAYINKAIPVVPTRFRPIYDLPDGSLNVSDVNHGYREILFINRELERLKSQSVGDEHLASLRAGLYQAYSGLIGLTEPVTRSGHFKGFISQIAGNQNKHGLYQSKVVMRRQDLTGRSTIINAPHLDMDSVGIPERMAREMYKPYLVRQLVTLAGLKPVEARKEVETGSDRVHSLLDAEMKRRPVLLNRAPALHKFSEVALMPQRVKGDAIQLNPLVFGGLNADIDGNCLTGSTKIYLMLPLELVQSSNQSFEELDMKFGGDNNIFIKTDSKILVQCRLDEVPHLKETRRKDRNGADLFDVPEGVEVLTLLPDGQGARWSPVTMFTREEGCELKCVTTKRGHTVTCSSNESLAVYDPEQLTLVRAKPADSIGKIVAVAASIPTSGDRYSFDTGWLIGAWLSDGWCNSVIGYTKCSKKKRDHFVAAVEQLAGSTVTPSVYEEYHDSATNAGISGQSIKLHICPSTPRLKAIYEQLSRLVDREAQAVATAAGEPNRTCLFKRMPSNLAEFSREALLGLLTGLLEGDGTLQVSHSKDRPQVMASYATSSELLKDGIILLGKLLGIRVTSTVQYPKEGRRQRAPAYAVRFSTVDLYRVLDELRFTEETEAVTFLRNNPPTKDDLDVVPVPLPVLRRFFGSASQAIADNYSAAALQTTASKYRKTGVALISRVTAEAMLTAYTGEVDRLFEHFSAVVRDHTTHWDTVTAVTDVPTEPVYDLEVRDTKVFAIASGLVVYDTVGVHVPHSEAAREELLRNVPSRNLMSPKSGEVQHTVGKEATLGLYMMTRPAAGTPVAVDSPAAAVEKFKQHKLELNAPLRVAGREGTWTVGHFLLNAELPEQYKLKSPVTFGGKQYKQLANSLAASHPEQTGQVLSKLKDLGFDASTRLGFSLNLRDLVAHNTERDEVAKEVAAMMKDDPIKAIKHAEKRLEEILDKHVSEDNPYAMMSYKSGASMKHRLNVRQLILAPGGVTDLKGKIVPVPLMRSYADGLTMPQYWATLPGARKGIADRAVSTQDTGAFNKELVNSTIGLRITAKDCGTGRGIDLPADHPDLGGRWVAAGPHAGRLIDPGLLSQLRKEGKSVTVRSALTCAQTEGVCQHCAGLSESNRPHPIGFHIGAYAGTTISEPITQMVLRCNAGENLVTVRFKKTVRVMTLKQLWEELPGAVHVDGGLEHKVVSGVRAWDGQDWVSVEHIERHAPDDELALQLLDSGKSLVAQLNHPTWVRKQDKRCGCGSAELTELGRSSYLAAGSSKKVYAACANCGEHVNMTETAWDAWVETVVELKDSVGCYVSTHGAFAPEKHKPPVPGYTAGFYCAEGCVERRETPRIQVGRRSGGNMPRSLKAWTPYGVVFTQNAGAGQDYARGRIEQELGRKLHVSGKQLRLHDRILAGKWQAYFGVHANNKALPAEWLGASKAWFRSFLSGLFDGDGHIKSHGTPCLDTTSLALAYQVQWIAERLGGYARVYTSPWREHSANQGYKVDLYLPCALEGFKKFGAKDPDSRRNYRGPLFDRVRDLKPVQYAGYVYDIATTSGRFTANGVVTHNSFHSQGAIGGTEVGYKRIRQLFTMPENIRGKATLAKEPGTVDAVIETDRGGWEVSVGGVKHFVPTELGLAVKVGEHVKQGAQLSARGVLKIQEVAEYRGHEAARDQLIHDLDSEMRSAGQGIRRRIYEAAVRPLVNRIEVLDAGDAAQQGVVTGDVMNANYVLELNKTLKHPIVFKPIVMSIREVPFSGEDFVGPLMYQRLPQVLKEAPAVGGVTQLKGFGAHPVVEYAWGNISEPPAPESKDKP